MLLGTSAVGMLKTVELGNPASTRINRPRRYGVTQRLEGSRFIRWQLYQLAASGSRKLPGVWNSDVVYVKR
jgi:hypothetical protein